VPKKYPNIAKIFDKEWFESEFKKEKEEMHLLARQFTYDEEDRISLHLIHLEDYLATMQEEIARDENKKHFYEGLRDKDFHKYRSTLAEIEIASLFKNMGFPVQLEPPIPDSGKNRSGDIKIIDAETEVFIEVRTIRDKNGEILDKGKWVEMSIMKFHRPIDFKSKIEDEIHGLSGLYPGIVVLYLDPSIINGRDIEKAFYDGTAWIVNGEVVHIEPGESAMDYTIISALLVYSHSFSDGSKIRKELHLNPKANISLPDSIITKFRDSGIEIKEEPIELERN
ncbi:MAG: hypothetical protein IMF19_03555, partial [Proteobacteria bacterium]|nr:hypothetical protein [Pseudomonadota bacterium]